MYTIYYNTDNKGYDFTSLRITMIKICNKH